MKSVYFNERELVCSCGCGTLNVKQRSLDKLDKARGMANIPFIISSACRCKNHNLAEGGSITSSHIAEDRESEAFDIVVVSSYTRLLITKALLEAGFNRIGQGSNFIHVDDDLSKARDVMWVYS